MLCKKRMRGNLVGPTYATIMSGAYYGDGVNGDAVRATLSFRLKVVAMYTFS